MFVFGGILRFQKWLQLLLEANWDFLEKMKKPKDILYWVTFLLKQILIFSHKYEVSN
jgi:hypothetical protein